MDLTDLGKTYHEKYHRNFGIKECMGEKGF